MDQLRAALRGDACSIGDDRGEATRTRRARLRYLLSSTKFSTIVYSTCTTTPHVLKFSTFKYMYSCSYVSVPNLSLERYGRTRTSR